MARDEGTFRHPFSWRSRIFRATVALLMLVLVVRLVWGWQTHRALAARLAELRDQGQPVDVADVVYEPVPDAQNAWHFEMLAAGAMAPGVDPPAASTLTYNEYPPFPPAWWKLAEASEKANAKVFTLARQARQRSRVQFRDRLTSPVFQYHLPYLSTARQLAITMGDGALYAHMKGNDPEALDRALDLFHLAWSLRHDDLLISQLVVINIEALACERIRVIAPGLRLRPESYSAAVATRDRVNQLVRRLLDEELVWGGLAASLRIEQLTTIDATLWASTSTWFIRPLADRQVLRDVRNFQLVIRASRMRTKPQVESVLANMRTEPDNRTALGLLASLSPTIPRYSRAFNVGGCAWMPRYLETAYRVLADRRATAVSLAAQLYRADHGGAWPARLQDLVPAYLPVLPADPYHDDGRPLGYVVLRLPDGAPRPLVYFDAGETDHVLIDPAPLYDWHQEYQPDSQPHRHRDVRQYRDLSRFTPPPSPKAVDDNPEEPDAPGQEY